MTTKLILLCFTLLLEDSSVHGVFNRLRAPSAAKRTNDTLIIAVGGLSGTNDGGETISNVEIYSIASNTHRDASSMPDVRREYGSAMYNNQIYVMGGFDGFDIKSQIWSYDIAADQWNNSLPKIPRFGSWESAGVALDGVVYQLGGVGGDATTEIEKVYAYDIAQNKWTTLDTLNPQPAISSCAVTLGKTIYYMPERFMFRSDDGAKSWKNLSAPAEFRREASCVSIGTDTIMLIGGLGIKNEPLDSAEIYNVMTNTWTPIADTMSTERAAASAVVLPNSSNNVLICGGYDPGRVTTDSCEIYDWSSQKWTVMDDYALNKPRRYFSMFAVST